MFLASCAGTSRDTAQRAPESEQPAPAPASTPAPGDTVHPDPMPYLPPWNFMSLSTAGIDTFLVKHPTYDGRGVLILILDTGVDMSIAGLVKTSTGEQKVIDAIDFSNSNVVTFTPAKMRGQGADRTATDGSMDLSLKDIQRMEPPPAGDEIYIGGMDESIYRNSSVRDFDGDGDAGSFFGAILYRAADGWRVALDTDGDGSMAGERGIASYREHFETLQFAQKSPGLKSPLTFAANIDPASKSVGFHYDMGGHGTHVAGIAAGFGINREPGFNGVAPGARIISGKFSGDTASDNTVTGSMKRAYEYAAHLADSLQAFHIPVVVNMSFGIGSALEGRSDIENFLDELIPEHPNLYVVTSAGNEGPGLSTTGIPSSASRIISVGAALPEGIGRDGYNASLDRDIIWDFSSRGGEVDKPDVLAPGTAVSTIPRYAFQSRESGTSMASPYTAGVVALLLSAMRQEDSAWMPTQGLISRALRSSGTILPDYPLIEQGGGMINVNRAYQMLKSYRNSGFADDFQLYRITTFSPNYPDGNGTTAFWRSSYVPAGDWRQTFRISRYIPDRLAGRDGEFFRAYTLESTHPWLSTVQKTIYIRGRNDMQVDVLYDREKMREPGIYSGRIIGKRASSAGAAPAGEVEFELVNTVIVPYTFSPDSNYTVTTPMQTLPAGVTRRFYFAPPAGAAAVTFTLGVPKGSRSIVSGKIANRFGVTSNYLPQVKGTERTEASNTLSLTALGDGVIEVVVQADAFEGAGGSSEFTLGAHCIMLSMMPAVERTGSARVLKLETRATGTEPVRGDFNYMVKGYGRVVRDTMKGDTWSMPVTMRKGDGALWISTTFTPEAYMRSTDILVRLVDNDGFVQAEEAMNTPSAWLFLPNFYREADSTTFRLEIIFGSTEYESIENIPVEIKEHHVRPTDPKSLGGFGSELQPYIPRTLTTKLSSITGTPKGYYNLGEIGFKPRGSDQTISMEFTFD